MTDTSALGTTTTGAPMELDVERLIGSHACIVANSGGGKSGLIRRLLEVTHGRVQHIVLDVEDEYYTLRERFDYVIAGGDGGDAPATVESAPGLALATLQHGFDLIVQLNDLGPDGAPAFVGRFLLSLISAPRELWRPVLVVLDEAQRFAPQDGSTSATAGVKALAAQGRKRGFTAILASQRIAKIDADVRGDINNWLLGRVGQALDRRTMADALGFTQREGRERFPGLAPRSFWAFGPALADEPTLFTVADVETTPVKPGQAKVPTPPPAEALRAILQGLAKVEPPKSDSQIQSVVATDDNRLSGEVARLKERVRILEGDNRALETDRDNWKQHAEVRMVLIERARAALQANGDEIPAPSGGHPAPLPRREERAAPPKAPRPASGAAPSSGSRPGPLQRILDSLAWWAAFGIDQPRREQVAFIAGYSPTSGGLFNLLGTLRGAGMLDYPSGGCVALTGAGRAAATVPDVEMTRGAFHAQVRAKLSGPQVRVLDPILAAYPEEITSAALAEAAGYSPTSGGFFNLRGSLRTLGLIHYPSAGTVRAADWLFP